MSAMSDVVWEIVLFLLQWDLFYFALGALAILILLWVLNFIITLKEDSDEDHLHKRKDHRHR